MGHSGKFVISEDSPVVFDSNHPRGEYTVLLEDDFYNMMFLSRLSIITGDGYKYEFGYCLNNYTPIWDTKFDKYGTHGYETPDS